MLLLTAGGGLPEQDTRVCFVCILCSHFFPPGVGVSEWSGEAGVVVSERLLGSGVQVLLQDGAQSSGGSALHRVSAIAGARHGLLAAENGNRSHPK